MDHITGGAELIIHDPERLSRPSEANHGLYEVAGGIRAQATVKATGPYNVVLLPSEHLNLPFVFARCVYSLRRSRILFPKWFGPEWFPAKHVVGADIEQGTVQFPGQLCQHAGGRGVDREAPVGLLFGPIHGGIGSGMDNGVGTQFSESPSHAVEIEKIELRKVQADGL
jgi:hypothetical protein